MPGIFIIAEAGVNHNGDINLAYDLIDEAHKAGVDAVKFQTWKTEKILTRKAPKAAYQMETTDSEESQFDMIRKLELSYNDFAKLKSYCDKKGIIFMSSSTDPESLDFLLSIGMEKIKTSSADLTNFPFLKYIAGLGKEVILSTGMADTKEIRATLDLMTKYGQEKNKITLLHCNTEYPTPFSDVNLRAMLTMRDEFDVNTGYSDHTLGIEVPIAAAALGATVIEKHFTLNKTMEGPDHKASLEPHELSDMVRAIRNIEKALGTGVKKASESEAKNIAVVRKSIVANKKIVKGEIFTEENLTTKRPGTGISPMNWEDVIGKKAPRDFDTDDIIEID